MNKEEYQEWVSGQDSYPKHDHTWTVRLYHRPTEPGEGKRFYRQFGPFTSKDEASNFALSYKETYTVRGFVVGWEVQPVCTPIDTNMGGISDGYHTFDELYEHRHALFLSLMSLLPGQSWYSSLHDDGSSYSGWFIAGINLPYLKGSGTITYHLPDRLLEQAEQTGATHLEKAPPWDGHTAHDVVRRLHAFLALTRDESVL